MPTAEQLLQFKHWLLIVLAVCGFFALRQINRYSDKLFDLVLGKVFKRFRELREHRRQERQRMVEELRSSSEARQIWMFREIRLRTKLVAQMVTGGVLTLIAPASSFLFVISFSSANKPIGKYIFVALGLLSGAGFGSLMTAWGDWWLKANDMRDMLNEAIGKKQSGNSAEIKQ